MSETAKQSGTEYLEIDHPWVSHRHVPIYEFTFPPEASDEELAAFVRAREEWATRAHYPVAWVVQLSNLTKANAKQRRTFAEHLKRFEHHDVQWNAGSALIVPSGWLRGLVTGGVLDFASKVPAPGVCQALGRSRMGAAATRSQARRAQR